jgi:serine protease Do
MEMAMIGKGDKNIEDRELITELNRKYADRDQDPSEPEKQKYLRLLVRGVALLLALVFLFTVTGRWLSVFTGPAYSFLRESWLLSSDPVVDQAKKAVVQVFVENRAGSLQGSLRGSGFNIREDGLIVTNRHLVEDAAIIRVTFPDRGLFAVSKWVASADEDLAVLLLQEGGLPFLPLAEVSFMPGEDVLVIGNPLQFARIANRGKVAGYRQVAGRETLYLVIEAMIYPGSSGSPVMNAEGEVGGIIFATLRNRDPEEVKGLAVDVSALKYFLNIFLLD